MEYKLALVQHPMYFLIRADSVCAERTPPWGAADIEAYIARIRENLAVLRKYPQLRLGYEWSAYELELLHQDAPDVFDEMMEMVHSGRCTLYNGTYSQPHLQTLSSEANYRQFEVAAKVYRDLCRHQVVTYAHQECSLNEQTPQLLKAFGIRCMPLPHFISTLVIEGGEITFHSKEGTMTVHGSEFTEWRGLDGTLVDVYLEEPVHLKIKEWIDLQEIKGLLHVPPVLIEIPDLVSVNDQWLEDRKQADFVLLDEELEKRLEKYPPRFQSRIFTNWSYIEGIRAEELSRNNYLAERSALNAEALNAMAYLLTGRAPQSTDAVWKTILATQHHDVYCFCGPEIRGKCIDWLKDCQVKTARMVQAASQDILARLAPLPQAGEQVVVFNTVPNPVKAPLSVETALPDPAVFKPDGSQVACEVAALDSASSKVTFLAETASFGYTSYGISSHAGAGAARKFVLSDRYVFENSYYRCALTPEGCFSSILLKPGGEEILDAASQCGNQLAGQDTTGLGSKHEGTINIRALTPIAMVHWQSPKHGPELKWQLDAPPELIETSLGARYNAHGALNASIHAGLSIRFYRDFPRIDFEWEFDFQKASVGSFFDDETKLRVLWPLSFTGQIHHDIAFGVVSSLEERPFFPASWVDISDQKMGFAYIHQGTIKHWVKDRTLANCFAWGQDTDAIGNRMDTFVWPKTFDQRLDGRHTIRYAIYPHHGDWRSGDVVSMARSFTNPPLAMIKSSSAGGKLPLESNLIQLKNPDQIATAVKMENEDVVCRLYSVGLEPEPVDVDLHGLRVEEIATISGEPVQELNSFKIASLRLRKAL